MPSDRVVKLGDWDRPADMPDSLATEVSGWNIVAKGPSDSSFYSTPGTPWSDPPEGCRRVGNRWNIATDQGRPAFITDRPLPNRTTWVLATFEAGTWRVLSAVPANGRAAARDLLRDRADRLVASRRWARGDVEMLQELLGVEAVARDALVADDEAKARSLRSLTTLRLAIEVTGEDAELPAAAREVLRDGAGGSAGGSVVWMDADGKAVATDILAWHAKKHAKAVSRADRGVERRERGEEIKESIAAAVQNAFPGMPSEVATAAAARLTPSVAKLGRRPGLQNLVDAVVEIRLERWRQVVESEPEVAARLLAMRARGDTGRARKRYRDQRAVERVAAEIRAWRGDLEPVSSRQLP